MKKFIYFIPLFAAILVSGNSLAVENKQDESYFLTSCNEYLEDSTAQLGQACSDYIHGYLAGARIVEAMFITHLEDEHNKLSSFTERAYRTRVGTPDDEELPSAPFCLPESEFNSDIMTEIAPHLPDSVLALDVLDQRIYEGLTKSFPCQ